MKKWIVFFVSSIIVLLFTAIFNFEILTNRITAYHNLKELYSSIEVMHTSEIKSTLNKECIVPIIKSSIIGVLSLILVVFNTVFLVSIAMHKITLPNITENIDAYKAHREEKKAERKQRKLEKAKAKVEQLQEQIQKDDELL